VLRRPAGRDREPGPSAGIEVVADAVVVPAAGESAGAQSGDVAVAVAVAERERPLGVRAVRRTGSTETSVRPASASVGTATSGEGARRETHRSDHSGVRRFPCCVDCVCHCSVAVLFCH